MWLKQGNFLEKSSTEVSSITKVLAIVTAIMLVICTYLFFQYRHFDTKLNSNRLVDGAVTTAQLPKDIQDKLDAAIKIAGALPVNDADGNLNSCDSGQVLSFTNGKVVCVTLTSSDGANGSTGDQGLKGYKGDKGDTGQQGATGSSGIVSTLNGFGITSGISSQVLHLELTANPNGGLEANSNGLTLLGNCAANQILKFMSGAWVCANDSVGSVSAADLTSGTTGVTVTGGTGAVLGSGANISIATAAGSQTGLLNAVDWTTFNNKENALTFTGNGLFSRSANAITAATCSNDKVMKFSGTSWACADDQNTTYTAGAGLNLSGTTMAFDPGTFTAITSVAGSDQILIYDGTSSKRITYNDLFSGVLGSLNYRGAWNATSNSPNLSALCTSGTKGYYYVVSTAGTTALDGINTWNIGDWAVCNGAVWQRIQTANGVSSVFNRGGAITAQNGDYNASQITNTSSGGIAATNTQDALNELDTEKLGTALASGLVFIGNGSGAATGKALSGAVTLSNAGVVTLQDDVVTSSKIMNGTILFADIASNSCTNGQIVKFNGSSWACGTDNDTATTYTAANTGANANTPISISGTTVGFSSATTNGQYWAWDGTKWALTTPASGLSVGTIDNQTKSANGAVISGNTLYMQTADASNVGLVSTGTQTLAGDKTLSGSTTLSGGLTVTSSTTTGAAASITANSLTTGSGLTVASSSATTSGNSLVSFTQSSSTAAATTLTLGNSGTGLSLAISNGGLTIATGADYTTTGSANNVSFANSSNVRLNGASAQTITGIAGGSNGKLLILNNVHATSTVTLVNQNGSSTAANRIVTQTGGDVSLPPSSSAILLYDSGSSRWRVISLSVGSPEFQYYKTLVVSASGSSGQQTIPTNAKSLKIVINSLSTTATTPISINLFDSSNNWLTGSNYLSCGQLGTSGSSSSVCSTGNYIPVALGSSNMGRNATANAEVIIRDLQSTTGNPFSWTAYLGGTDGTVNGSGRYTGTTKNTGGFSLTSNAVNFTTNADIYIGY